MLSFISQKNNLKKKKTRKLVLLLLYLICTLRVKRMNSDDMLSYYLISVSRSPTGEIYKHWSDWLHVSSQTSLFRCALPDTAILVSVSPKLMYVWRKHHALYMRNAITLDKAVFFFHPESANSYFSVKMDVVCTHKKHLKCAAASYGCSQHMFWSKKIFICVNNINIFIS